jgi:DUF1365 family protein
MKSQLYIGQVRHRRFTPKAHSFNYKLFMMYLDLDELPDIFSPYRFWSFNRSNIASFKREDHMGDPSLSLKQSIYDFVYEKSGIKLEGPVGLLTHLRYFGFGFNPVSFYYCFDSTGEKIEAIISEVNNTPWGEQHCYLFVPENNLGTANKHQYQFNKDFHVSPFHPMNQTYQWSISAPEQHIGIHIENWQDTEKAFDATLSLDRQLINAKNLSRILYQFPFMTIKVVSAIYYQALKLWLKGIPFYSHPKKVNSSIMIK